MNWARALAPRPARALAAPLAHPVSPPGAGDAIMKPPLTPLLRFAAEQGCRTIGGKTMLDGQAPEVARFFGFGA